jgi:hypothetical protein
VAAYGVAINFNVLISKRDSIPGISFTYWLAKLSAVFFTSNLNWFFFAAPDLQTAIS